MPDAELSVVGECVAKETPVVRGTRERYRLAKGLGINDGVYTTAEMACSWVEINTAEVVAYGVELVIVFGKSLCRAEIERASIGREHGIGLVDSVLLQNLPVFQKTQRSLTI